MDIRSVLIETCRIVATSLGMSDEWVVECVDEMLEDFPIFNALAVMADASQPIGVS